ncbi:MAG TPA: hypothetical protein VF525_13120 [Pyrinomonadaceae bacterium]
MITGFNTDIEHNGTIYHVQTEDKGLRSPFILSLIYVGGEILASKRSPYNDLIAEGFDAQALAERLQRQHKLLCAAISAGRIEDLKRMQQREAAQAQPEVFSPAPTPAPAPPEVEPATVGASVVEAQPLDIPVDVMPRVAETVEETISEQIDELSFVHVEAEQALHLNLLEEREFRAGEVVTIRVRVGRGPVEDRVSVPNAEVTVKILGSEFRPLILRSKTDADGVALVHAWLPRFTAGRAAVLIRAVADDCAAELRRAIHH